MKKNVDKILIIRLSSIGDILLASPLIRVIRRKYPQSRIDFVVKAQFVDLLRANPHLDNLYTVETKKGRAGLKQLRDVLRAESYDLVVDIHDNFRSALLRRVIGARTVKLRKYKVRRFFLATCGWNFYRSVIPVHQRYINAMAPFDILDDGLGLELFIDEHVQKYTDEALQERGFQPKRLTICVAPGASKMTKRWPVDRFAAVASMLIDRFDAQILLLGDKHDAELTTAISGMLNGKTINVAGQFDLMQSACALKRADVALTNDSGLMHMATALGKPTAAIFGSTVRELGFFPVGPKNVVVENNTLSCRPCTHIGRRACPKKHFKCMLDIETMQVFKAVSTIIRESLP